MAALDVRQDLPVQYTVVRGVLPWVVVSLLGAGCSGHGLSVDWDNSPDITRIFDGNSLQAPQETAVTPGLSGALVSWSAVTAALDYNVYMSADGVADFALVATGLSPQPITGLTPGVPQYFAVTSVRGAVESNRSPVVRADPLGLLGPASSPTWHEVGGAAGDDFGRVIMAPGDVNGDGYPDMIVGARGYDDGATIDVGRVFLYAGDENGIGTTAAQTLTGTVAEERLGHAISAMGDWNADGFADVLITAPGSEGNSTEDGSVHLYLGSANGLVEPPAWTVTLNGEQLGYEAVPLDFNGDGFVDIAAGAKTGAGSVRVYFGSAGAIATTAAWMFSGTATSSFGETISVGDLNDDGRDDLMVGADSHDAAVNNVGAAYVFMGAAGTPDTVEDFFIEGTTLNEAWGTDVRYLGDVNGDGFGDFATTGDGYDDGAINVGRVEVYYGNGAGAPDTTADWFMNGDVAGMGLGYIARPSDVNGDGYNDVLVAGNGGGAAVGGEAWLFYGSSAGPSDTPDWEAESALIDADFGRRMDMDGDVNGDGVADLLICAYEGGASNEGEAYVYLGPPGVGPTVGMSPISFADTPMFGAQTCVVDWGDQQSDSLDPCTNVALDGLDHAYATPGEYEVRLTVTSASGAVGEGARRITVE